MVSFNSTFVPLPAPPTQLTQRPVSSALVATASRPPHDNLGDPLGPFGNDTLLNTHVNAVMGEIDGVELLEKRAAIVKREAESKRKQLAPFVQKLCSFIDESKNVDLIRWSDRGDSFIVLDEEEFAKTLIPEIFKHNKYISFVRQLNLYGFHKRVGLSDNSMRASERKNKGPSEFYHPYFIRGHPNLLWLINKPKGRGSQKKGKGARVKTEDGLGGESDGEGRDAVDDNCGQNSMLSIPQATSALPEAGSLQRCDMAIVLLQLQDIRKQQGEMSRTLSRLRNDHNQLYQQAVGFQTLHDQHRSSINAILTFLATLYNRGLDGQGAQNIAQMFANAIPHDQQQGNVLDIGDVDDQQQQQNSGNLSPHRRVQRLLMAPPVAGPPAPSIQSPISESQFQNALSQSGPGAIEELSETTQSDSPQVKVGPHNIMNTINSSNGQISRLGVKSMTFPDLLKHCKNANSISPLTSEQRNNMLQLIASTSAAESNNTLVSPHPAPPGLEQLRYTQAGIDELVRMQQDQETNLGKVSASIQPPSPSGSIPGLDDGTYFPDAHVSHFDENFNLDAFLDTGAYCTNGDGGGYTYDDFVDGVMGGNGSFDSGFDFGLDASGTGESERMVETGGSSSGGCRSEMKDDTHTGCIPSPVKKKRKT